MGGQHRARVAAGLDAVHARPRRPTPAGRRRRSYLRERDEIRRRTCFHPGCVRPTLVVALCLLAALAGAGGALFAVESGRLGRSRRPRPCSSASRSCAPRCPRRSSSRSRSLARGFKPQRIFAERAAGVVTVFSYFGAKPGGSTLEEGSGFVVDRDGIVLTAAHVIVSTLDAPRRLPTPAHAVYVQFSDGDRVPAQIVGWDPYDDVGVLRVSPSRARARAGAARRSRPTSRSASRSRRSARRSAPRPRSRSASSRAIDRTIPSLTTAYDLFDAIQTDAPINQGNSGGPLLDAARAA